MPEQFPQQGTSSGSEERFNLKKPLNLLERDGDPRKSAYVRKLVNDAREYWHTFSAGKGGSIRPSIFRLHKAEGLFEKKPDGGRKHMAPEHILTVMAGCFALARLLKLSEQDTRDLLLGAAVHDVNKDIEFQLVRESIKNPEAGYGQRGYDTAGNISAQKLKFAGVPANIIRIHGVCGHAACPDTETALQKEELSSEDIQKLVLHYIDDIVTNPNIIDPAITHDEQGKRLNALDRRCIQNEKNQSYVEYNEAWKNDPRNKTGETAFVMQRRVGHLVENKLAELLGVNDPVTLPEVIYKQMQKDIQDHWDKGNKG